MPRLNHTPLPISLTTCLVAALCGCVPIHQPSRSSAPGSAPPSGDIVGVVYDSSSGKPLQNAQLLLQRAQVDRPTVPADTAVIAWAMSDSAGQFAMHRIQSGRYVLLVRWIGYRVRLIPTILGAESGVELQILLPPVPCPERILNC
jgi:hypothetical protein